MSAKPSLPQAMLNGQLIAAADAPIPALGPGFQFGHGLFETMRLRGGRPVFLQRHLARLEAGLARIGLDWPKRDGLADRLREVIAASPASHDVLKLIVFAEDGGPGELIHTRASRYRPEDYKRGFRLHSVAASPPAPLVAGLKALAFLSWRLAQEAAQQAGADEALLIGADGELYEGSVSNVYLVRDGVVLTPPRSSGILPGIIREVLLEQSEPPVREELLFRDDLARADEVFVSNSILGVMPVSAWENQTWPGAAGPVTTRLRETIAEAELQDLSRVPGL